MYCGRYVINSFVFCWQKRIGKTPKTPRTLARVTAPTTGHADSPDTLVIGRKVFGARGKTPKPKRVSQAVSCAAIHKKVGGGEWGSGMSIIIFSVLGRHAQAQIFVCNLEIHAHNSFPLWPH